MSPRTGTCSLRRCRCKADREPLPDSEDAVSRSLRCSYLPTCRSLLHPAGVNHSMQGNTRGYLVNRTRHPLTSTRAARTRCVADETMPSRSRRRNLEKLRELLLGQRCIEELHLHRVRHHLIEVDRKSTRLNSSHSQISYAVFCLKKKTTKPRNSQFDQKFSASSPVIPEMLHPLFDYNPQITAIFTESL